MRRPLAALGLTCVTGVALVVPGVPGAASADPVGADCTAVNFGDPDPTPLTGDNPAYDDLHIAQAQAAALRAGAKGAGSGITVAVVDAPTTPADGLDTAHGVITAGIIKGKAAAVPVGLAPSVTLVDHPFYSAPRGSDGLTPTATRLAHVLGALPAGTRTVVLVPMEVGPDAALTRAVDKLVKQGALVVAPVGDRPSGDDPLLDNYADKRPGGEDAAHDVWPAAHPKVLAVGLSSEAGRGIALRNSSVDVAAPGGPTASYAMNSRPCAIAVPSTHWAAAEVAAAAALVWSAHPRDSAAAIRQRLEQTATGAGGATSLLIGYGEVQPVEAIERTPGKALDRTPAPAVQAQAPAERADVLADTRRKTVWWGLVGGGALVVLLLAGRRRAS